mgnify:CR=1 FL=1
MPAQPQSTDPHPSPRPLLSSTQMRAETQKCHGCLDGACHRGCPVGVDAGAFIRRLRTDNIAGALAAILNQNPLPETTALVCPAEQLCQADCANKHWGQAVQVCLLQRYAAHHGRGQLRRARPAIDTDRKSVV